MIIKNTNYIIVIHKIYDTHLLFSYVGDNVVNSCNVTQINYNYMISDSAFSIGCNEYLILDIPEFHLLDSNKESIEDAFAVIAVQDGCKTVLNNAHLPKEVDIKYFNPPLPRLQQFKVTFKNYNNSIVNFNGLDHFLVFKVSCLNQPGKYNNYVPFSKSNQ